jgi:hypothetical protein
VPEPADEQGAADRDLRCEGEGTEEDDAGGHGGGVPPERDEQRGHADLDHPQAAGGDDQHAQETLEGVHREDLRGGDRGADQVQA